MTCKANKIALIPARYHAQRFPGKLLEKLGDKSVILQTYLSVVNTQLFKEVAVITDSPLIYKEITAHKGVALMSQKDHICGTDRIAEAVVHYPWADIVVNVQGDEPFTQAAPLQALLHAMEDPTSERPSAASLMTPIHSIEELHNPNVVKVVTDRKHNALLFTRSASAAEKAAGGSMSSNVLIFRHIGVYAFRKEALLSFAKLTPGPLEVSEKLENLRFLEHGMHIKMVEVCSYPKGIDTPEDLEMARRWLLQNNTMQ